MSYYITLRNTDCDQITHIIQKHHLYAEPFCIIIDRGTIETRISNEYIGLLQN